jgi:hypothetical protein
MEMPLFDLLAQPGLPAFPTSALVVALMLALMALGGDFERRYVQGADIAVLAVLHCGGYSSEISVISVVLSSVVLSIYNTVIGHYMQYSVISQSFVKCDASVFT